MQSELAIIYNKNQFGCIPDAPDFDDGCVIGILTEKE